jgi:arylsulfatase A-like enzyme
MGYWTPNIDRIAREGALFTDAYAQQSCTAGRASFILGQHPFRTGLLTIGMPGSPQGIPDWAPTIADLLKPQGYATGQFGKNHLGDRDSHLSTMHGFDEFLGNLYHLNAEEEPETYYYPKDPEFRKKFGPRGVLHTWADGRGGQKIDDTGPLTRQRMETVDGEIFAAAEKFIDKSVADKKPFFVWFNTTRMHVWTHLKKSAQGRTGIGLYPDGMVEHDDMVGALLKKLDDLGIASNTIVVYSTDNGAETVTWPDGGTTPFRGEKGTTWEGGFRVPLVVRWPGVIKPGTVYNDIISQEDWLPTLLAAAGASGIKDRLKQGYQVGGKTWRVHLDGYDFLPYFKGAVPKSPREEIYYFGQGGELKRRSLERLEGPHRRPAWQHRDQRTRSDGLADHHESPGRSVREGPVRIGDVHPLVCRQHLALRARAAEAEGLSGHRARVSVSGGEQPERRQHQLHHLEGGGGPEAAEGAREPVAA